MTMSTFPKSSTTSSAKRYTRLRSGMSTRYAFKDTEIQVFQGMQEIGLTNATIKLRYPMTVELDAHPLPDELFNRRHRARPVAAKKVDEVVS